jgi:hypothetical protein
MYSHLPKRIVVPSTRILLRADESRQSERCQWLFDFIRVVRSLSDARGLCFQRSVLVRASA